jgi:hypothetical protein
VSPYVHHAGDGHSFTDHLRAILVEWLAMPVDVLPKNVYADALVKKSGMDWYIVDVDERRSFAQHSAEKRQAYICTRLSQVNWWLALLKLTLMRHVNADTFPEQHVPPYLRLRIGRHRQIRIINKAGSKVYESPC